MLFSDSNLHDYFVMSNPVIDIIIILFFWSLIIHEQVVLCNESPRSDTGRNWRQLIVCNLYRLF